MATRTYDIELIVCFKCKRALSDEDVIMMDSKDVNQTALKMWQEGRLHYQETTILSVSSEVSKEPR